MQYSSHKKPEKGFQHSFYYLSFLSNEQWQRRLINLHLCRNVQNWLPDLQVSPQHGWRSNAFASCSVRTLEMETRFELSGFLSYGWTRRARDAQIDVSVRANKFSLVCRRSVRTNGVWRLIGWSQNSDHAARLSRSVASLPSWPCEADPVALEMPSLMAQRKQSVSAAAFWGGCLHQLRLLQGYGWKAAENCEKLNQEDETLPVLLDFHLLSLPTPPFLPSFCWRAAFGEWDSLSGHSCLSLHLHENVKYNWTPAPEEDQK